MPKASCIREEMKKFDEDFTPLTGGTLRQIISDTNRDEV